MVIHRVVKKSYMSSWVFTAMQSVHIRMNSSLSPLKKILDPPMIMIFTEYIFRLLSINHLQLLFKRP